MAIILRLDRVMADRKISLNELAEKAIGFYLDYLEASNAGDFLPTALKSYVDGRLGKLEERLSSLSFSSRWRWI